MTRISRQQMFMEIAHIVSKRATCNRLNVGAVVVCKNRIVSIGYNGRPSGEPHCQGHECPGRFKCEETTHAEMNAIEYMPGSSVPEDIYVTDSPCENCANAISAWGFKRVFFDRPYRINDHLKTQPFKVYRILPNGSVIDWKTGEVVDV